MYISLGMLLDNALNCQNYVSVTEDRISVEHWVECCQQWKTKILREEPVPMPLCPPKIPLELAWVRTRPLRSATNRLSHGTTMWWQASEFVPFSKHLHNLRNTLPQHELMAWIKIRRSSMLIACWHVRFLT